MTEVREHGGFLCELTVSAPEGLSFKQVQARIRDVRGLLRDGTFRANPLNDYQISNVWYRHDRSDVEVETSYATVARRAETASDAPMRLQTAVEKQWASDLRRASGEVDSAPVARLHYGSPIELVIALAPIAQGLALFVWQLAAAVRYRRIRQAELFMAHEREMPMVGFDRSLIEQMMPVTNDVMARYRDGLEEADEDEFDRRLDTMTRRMGKVLGVVDRVRITGEAARMDSQLPEQYDVPPELTA